jgi:hypothetical protein
VNANLSQRQLKTIVEEAWEVVSSNLLEDLIQSMPAGIAVVIKANYTVA